MTVPTVVPLSDNSSTTDVPSAFLRVSVPYSVYNTTGTVFTCSVDARWAMGVYEGGPIADGHNDYVQTATIKKTRPVPVLTGPQYNFIPINDSSWRRVQIDTDWLNILTPNFDAKTPGWTSLAALLTNIGIDNSTGLVYSWYDMTAPLETVIATIVADGMSRQGYAANGGLSMEVLDRLEWLPWDDLASSRQSLLAGKYSFPRPPGEATRLEWSVVVGGYAYRADSVAYYLALTVLFLHAALALGHVVYVLWTRVCFDAWDSFLGLLVLAAKSGIPETPRTIGVFENASVGIQRYRTMSTEVCIRAKPSSSAATTGQEDTKILFGDEKLEAEYHPLKDGKTYG